MKLATSTAEDRAVQLWLRSGPLLDPLDEAVRLSPWILVGSGVVEQQEAKKLTDSAPGYRTTTAGSWMLLLDAVVVVPWAIHVGQIMLITSQEMFEVNFCVFSLAQTCSRLHVYYEMAASWTPWHFGINMFEPSPWPPAS